MTHFLREIAVPSQQLDGAVTFWMIPFRNPEVDIYLAELRRLHPSVLWRHKETGEETYTNPIPGDANDPIMKAQREASDWEEVYLWDRPEHVFLSCVPLTVDIEFHQEKFTKSLQALQMFWSEHNGNVKHNWEMFRQLIADDVFLAWLLAHNSTRDTSMDGPEELQNEPDEDADPNA